MAVIPFRVEVGDEVRTETGSLGRVEQIFTGPPRSNFQDTERYMQIKSPRAGVLYIPFSAIADSSRVLNLVYLKPGDPNVAYGDWRLDPRRPGGEPAPLRVRIGDRFAAGDPLTQPGEYICTACGFRRHSQQLREESGRDRFPPPHHAGAAWALDDYRP